MNQLLDRLKILKEKKGLKNIVLKTYAAVDAFVFLFAACCLDSQDWFGPFVICMLTGLWLVLFLVVNEEYYLRRIWHEDYKAARRMDHAAERKKSA